MNEHALRVLEYDKLREIVAGFAASEPGKEAVQAAFPVTEGGTVDRLLGETREFMQIMDRGEPPPFDGIRDIRRQVAKLAASGMTLTPHELLDIASTLGAGRRIKQFFQRIEKQVLSATLLPGIAERIRPLKPVEDAVQRAVDEKGEVKDSASPALRRIRKQIGRTRDEVLDRLSRILKAGAAENIVQESVVTIREDRYVLPLKPNFRQSLRGVVHGQSGSRATLFVEPLEVLEQNNRIAELRMEEREEIERILRELTALLAGEAGPIEATFTALARLDAVYARARFGREFRCTVPERSPDGGLRLRAVRHPLLVWKQRSARAPAEVTANDLDLGAGGRALIISGPNAGGKTVMLKTVGLACLMAQAGIPVTAAEGTALPVFSSMFADIGDEQSLEQDLSTFSSHATRIAEVLREAGEGSLVLLDELGVGTDPAEGAALGAAVLARLLKSGCMTVVTTHHGSLKLFAAQNEGAANGAMEFDPETLRPTYRFLPGMPGRSYGLDMARRVGIAGDVIRDAESRLGEHESGLEKTLERLEAESRGLRHAREETEKALVGARTVKEEAEALLRSARDESRTVKAKAREEARDVLHALRQKLKELSRPASVGTADAGRQRTEIDSLAGRIEPEEKEPAVAPPGHEFRNGDRVRVPRLRKSGTVLSVHKGSIEIDAGGLTLRIAAGEAVPVPAGEEKPRQAASTGWGAELREAPESVSSLNILGLRVDEAREAVERFLDRAVVNNLSFVTIIHGLGTGALKSLVAELLKQHPEVVRSRSGEAGEGGAGVTVVELKK